MTEKHIVDRDLTIAQLCLSPHNCRRRVPTVENTAPLEALIIAQGLRVPLEVHQMRGPRRAGHEKFGAFAGRRRYYSLQRAIERGDLPADLRIRAREYVGYSDADLVELSITENFRKDLEDHELYAGIARAHKLGHNVELIARNLGDLDAQLVARWVRLGSLAPEIFSALTTGEIDVARAKAYAATEDRALQLAVFTDLRRPRDLLHPGPADIRAALKVGDRELERRLAFVGEETYRAAGGRYELDLFAEDAGQRGRVVDEGLLRELLNEKLEFVRERVRANTTSPQLRFISDRPQNGMGGTDWTLQYRPREQDGDTVKLVDGVVAHIAIDDDGNSDVTYWWPSAAAKHGSARPSAPPPPGRRLADVFSKREGAALSTSSSSTSGVDPYEARRTANAALKEEAGLTADLIEILRSQRRLILQARMIDAVDRPDGDTDALDFLIWTQLRQKLGHARSTELGAAILPGIGDPPATLDALREMPAWAIRQAAVAELQQQEFMTEADLGDAFRAYCGADRRMKGLAVAIVAGLSLERSLDADGYRLSTHDALADQLELDEDQVLRRYWVPTTGLLDKLPKDQRAAIAQPFVEAATWAPWPRLSGPALTLNVLQVVTGQHPATRPALAAEAESWIHPQLRFRTGPIETVGYLEAVDDPAIDAESHVKSPEREEQPA